MRNKRQPHVMAHFMSHNTGADGCCVVKGVYNYIAATADLDRQFRAIALATPDIPQIFSTMKELHLLYGKRTEPR